MNPSYNRSVSLGRDNSTLFLTMLEHRATISTLSLAQTLVDFYHLDFAGLKKAGDVHTTLMENVNMRGDEQDPHLLFIKEHARHIEVFYEQMLTKAKELEARNALILGFLRDRESDPPKALQSIRLRLAIEDAHAEFTQDVLEPQAKELVHLYRRLSDSVRHEFLIGLGPRLVVTRELLNDLAVQLLKGVMERPSGERLKLLSRAADVYAGAKVACLQGPFVLDTCDSAVHVTDQTFMGEVLGANQVGNSAQAWQEGLLNAYLATLEVKDNPKATRLTKELLASFKT